MRSKACFNTKWASTVRYILTIFHIQLSKKFFVMDLRCGGVCPSISHVATPLLKKSTEALHNARTKNNRESPKLKFWDAID